MIPLSELEREFQAYVFGRENGLPERVRDGAHAGKPVMLGVYRHAYWARLVEVLRNDYDKLRRLVGDAAFDELARAYLARHPSRHFSARWVGDRLAAFLAETDPFRAQPALAAMAAFEWAQASAFDAADEAVVEPADLAAIAPHSWPAVRFRLHGSAQRLALPPAVVEAWERLHRNDPAPAPESLGEPAGWLVWRQGFEVRYRRLPADEAAALDAVAADADFATLCETFAAHVGEERAAFRAAKMVQGWIAGGLLAELLQQPDSSR
jgi:hypothetical protein